MSDFEETLNISLVIDDNHTTHLDININNLAELDTKCTQIVSKYYLDPVLKNRLKRQIYKTIIELKEHREKALENNNIIEQNVQRLYYEQIEKTKAKDKYIKKINEENVKKIISGFTFTPEISKKSNELYKRDFAKIEDKLYYEYVKRKEQIGYQRLLNKLKQDRSVIKHQPAKQIVIESNKDIRSMTVDSTEIKEDEMIDKMNNDNIISSQLNSPKNNSITNLYKRSYTEKFKNQRSNSINNPNFVNTPTKTMYQYGKTTSMKNLIHFNPSFEITPGRSIKKQITYIENLKPLTVERIDEVPETSPRKKHKKSKNVNVYTRLYINKDKLQKLKEKKNEIADRQLKLQCPFSPKLGHSARVLSNRDSNHDEFINRLTYSKKIQNITNSLSMSNFQNYKSVTSLTNSLNRVKSCKGKIAMTTSNSGPLLTTSIETGRRKNKSLLSDVKSIREAKQENTIFNEINEIRVNNEKKKIMFDESYHNGLKKYKLNYLKNVFEKIIEIDIVNIDDLKSLDDCRLPSHIIEDVIVPTCSIIQDRGLEFNFYNFYQIADEILNVFFKLT
jgi:hypothetical protein